MAYAYNDQDQAAQKSNIFGDQQQGGGNFPGVSDALNKGQSLDVGGNAEPGASGSAPKPAQVTDVGMKSGLGKALTKGASQQQAPKAFQNIQNQLGQAEENLKQQAAQYTQGAQKQAESYKVGQPDIDKAIGGDQAAQNQLATRLSQPAPQAFDYQAFKPKVDIANTQNLQSEAGLQNILRKEGGAQYNAKEAALDASLIRRNPQFTALAQQLGQREQALRSQQDQTAQDVNKQAQEALAKGYASGTDELRAALGGQVGALEAAAQARKSPLEQQLAQQVSAAQAPAMNEDVMRQLSAEMKLGGGDQALAANMLGSAGVNAGSFYKAAAPQELGLQQLMQNPEIQKYNAIQSLLGGKALAPTQEAVGPAGAFDDAAYKDALRQSAMNQLQKTRQDFNVAEAAAHPRIQAGLTDYRNKQVSDIAKALGVNQEFATSLVNPEQYYGDQAHRGYTGEEAANLNRLAGQIGMSQNYGQGFDNSFKSDAYRKALQNVLNQSATSSRQIMNAPIGGGQAIIQPLMTEPSAPAPVGRQAPALRPVDSDNDLIKGLFGG